MSLSGRLARRRLPKQEAEMNITAFMNLMVVLVPFLLITAVFSRMTILELNLPAGGPPPPEAKQSFELEVVVRKDRIEIADRGSGLLGRYPVLPGGHDFEAVREKLKAVKAEYPEMVNATILLEPETSYDVVVQMMDTVRTFPAQQGERTVQAELFPEISVGDAPT